MADKKTRADLEILFSSGKIPTQSNFADFIASGVNQKDDGLQKTSDTPLKIQAPVTVATDAKTPKDMILFYEHLEDDAAKWKMSIRSGGLEISRGAQSDFVIDANGSVGIGTSNPKQKLEITGNLQLSGNRTKLFYQGDTDDQIGSLAFYSPDKGNTAIITPYDNTGKNLPNSTIRFGGFGSFEENKVNLNVSGNVGIGTMTPGFPLTFANAAGDKISLWGQSGNSYGFGIQNALLQIHTDSEGADIAFGSGSSGSFKETMRVKGKGNVGIGTTTPLNKLHVIASGGFGGDNADGTTTGGNVPIVAQSNGTAFGIINGSGRAVFALNIEGDTGTNATRGVPTFYDRYDGNWRQSLALKNGNVGIGTTDVKAKLHVVGGAIMPAVGNGESAGILFPPDAFGGGSDRAYIRYYLRPNESPESTTLEIGNQNDTDDHISLMPGGNVGIGTIMPTKAKLVIEGKSNPGDYLLRGYMDANGTITDHNRVWGNGSFASIWASNEIVASAMRVQSDTRIKKVVEIPDSRKDLLFINKLNPVKYEFIDVIENGYEIKSGFIAQEVEKINPAMVKRSTNFIPNIYRQAEEIKYSASEKTLCISVSNSHDCVVGDKVRIITDKRQLELTIESVISENQLILAGCEEKPEKVFVFGKEVRDFLSLDYNGIFTTGVGAIQELSKQVKELQDDCEQRKTELEGLKSQLRENKKMLNTRLNRAETVR